MQANILAREEKQSPGLWDLTPAYRVWLLYCSLPLQESSLQAPSGFQPDFYCSVKVCVATRGFEVPTEEIIKNSRILYFSMNHNVHIFLWSALESFPTTSPLLSPFFLSFLISHLPLPTPVLTSLTQSQSYCGGNFSFGCFCLHASLVGQSKNLVKGTFFFAFDYRLQRGMNK